MRRPLLFYCDAYHFPLPGGHKFPLDKYRMLREALERHNCFRFALADFAPRAALERVHDAAYIDAFLQGALSEQEQRRIGFPWSEVLVQRTLSSVGGALGAAQEAMETGWGGVLAGGTHHAFRDCGAGFCVFNDIAVATEYLRAERNITRVAVVDLDVHQGDGTAAIFADDPNVFTLSAHGAANFPFRKQQSDLDLAFERGTEDSAFLQGVATALEHVVGFAPQVIIYQSGVDGLKEDTLGHLHLTHEGLRNRDAMVFQLARNLGVPLVLLLGGGYASPISATVAAHENTFLLANEILG
jgi:acetoin utilization deacetylase AcuC-like enzyme